MMEIDEMVDGGEMSRQCLRAGRKLCELMPNEVIVISAVPNREILLLPKFAF